jgi:hypothetical protein
MADEPANGDIPFSGNPTVDAALKRIRAKFRDLEDAMIVQAHLEKRLGEQVKRQTELWDNHDASLTAHQQRISDHDAWMKHFEEKLDALTNILMRRHGGPEATEQ